jgi:NADH-quinone oxidoreductase subunit J
MILASLLSPVTAEAVAATQLPAFTAPRGVLAILGAFVLLGAILTITRRNPISAVMWLVGTFFGLAGTYALLFAHFLAALQVLVYAGAIMVLFIFVVMVLNRDEVEPYTFRSLLFRGPIVALSVGYLLYRFYLHTRTLAPVHPEDPSAEFGTVAQVGMILFTDYLFIFEAVSVLLLVAVIAAVVVARAARTDVGGPMETDLLETELANEPGHGLTGPAALAQADGHDDDHHAASGGHH